MSQQENSLQTTDQQPILVFQLAGQTYGLAITAVKQIIEMVTITHLPHLPASIQGVINLHGYLVPIIDLRLRFGYPLLPYGLHTPIIIIHHPPWTIGLVVDEVETILEITAANLKTQPSLLPPPSNGQPVTNTLPTYLSSIAQTTERLIPILNTATILSTDEQHSLSPQAGLTETTAGGLA